MAAGGSGTSHGKGRTSAGGRRVGLAMGRRQGSGNGFNFHIYINASKFSPFFFFSSKMEISMKTC